MMKPLAALSIAASALVLSGAPAASAGACVATEVPRRGTVTACVDQYGCTVYLDPGGRTIAACITPDSVPTGACVDAADPWRACVNTGECLVFFTTGRPPGLCV